MFIYSLILVFESKAGGPNLNTKTKDIKMRTACFVKYC